MPSAGKKRRLTRTEVRELWTDKPTFLSLWYSQQEMLQEQLEHKLQGYLENPDRYKEAKSNLEIIDEIRRILESHPEVQKRLGTVREMSIATTDLVTLSETMEIREALTFAIYSGQRAFPVTARVRWGTRNLINVQPTVTRIHYGTTLRRLLDGAAARPDALLSEADADDFGGMPIITRIAEVDSNDTTSMALTAMEQDLKSDLGNDGLVAVDDREGRQVGFLTPNRVFARILAAIAADLDARPRIEPSGSLPLPVDMSDYDPKCAF